MYGTEQIHAQTPVADNDTNPTTNTQLQDSDDNPCDQVTHTKSNDPYGDFIHPDKAEEILRIYSINCKGLSISQSQERIQHFAQQASANAIDMLGLIATDTNWSNQAKSIVSSNFKKYYSRSVAQYTQIASKSTQLFQPGGNCILVDFFIFAIFC
jgi:hypothetical protein